MDIYRNEKALADYRTQLGKSFEHEARLKELLAKQDQLNAALDLDKHEQQVVAEELGQLATPPHGFVGRIECKQEATAISQ
jgi:hypothetical protein